VARLTFSFALALAIGCASSDEGPGGSGDAGRGDAAPEDAGRPDTGTLTCPSGQHRCGGGCVDDRPNEPTEGCALGCGEACPEPEGGVATCTAGGMCDFTCEAPFVREPDGCACEAATCEALGAMCGEHDDGCGGTLSCGTCADGTACIAGACGCAEDDAEPNDARTIPHLLPDFTDDPDTSMTFDAFNLSDATDEDWYELHVADDFDFGNPQVRVTLDGIPAGSDYDLGVWYVCDSGGDGTTCTSGATDNMIGRGCTSETTGALQEAVELDTNCSGSGDDGTLYVRVTSRTWAGSCDGYALAVSVE